MGEGAGKEGIDCSMMILGTPTVVNLKSSEEHHDESRMSSTRTLYASYVGRACCTFIAGGQS